MTGEMAEYYRDLFLADEADELADDHGVSFGVSFCPVCDAENEPMGQLGNRIHYRCRACGIQYSEELR